MHAFKCPKCGRLLATPAAARKATVKCRACGALFVGDTTPIVSGAPEKQPPGGARAGAAGATAHRRPIRRGPSNTKILLILTMVVMVLGLGIMFLVMGKYFKTVELIYVDGNGKQVRERLPEEEAKGKREQLAKDAEAAALAARPKPKAIADSDGNATAEAQDTGPALDPNEMADKGIELKEWTKVPEGTASHRGAIIGIVHSNHESCLPQVDVHVALLDKSGKTVGTAVSASILYIPSDGNVRFTAKYSGTPTASVDKITILAMAPPAETPIVCWDANVTKVEIDKGKAVATGVAVVIGERKLHSPMIHCEFYDAHGVLLGDVTGELEGAAKGIAHAGAAMKFTATLKLDEKKLPTGVTACARLVGNPDDPRGD